MRTGAPFRILVPAPRSASAFRIARPPPGPLAAPLRPLVTGADVLLLNVEGAIGAGRAPRKCARGSTLCYAFRQAPEGGAPLRRLGASAAAGRDGRHHQ